MGPQRWIGEEAFLIQLHSINDLGPIGELLEDTSIAKTGVALRDDIRRRLVEETEQTGRENQGEPEADHRAGLGP